jgi:S-DNA-T family DNA segregation ATPase FtsK/SpoIIIE
MAKDKKRSGDHSRKHIISQEAIYVLVGLLLFIVSIMGLISRSGIIGNLIRYFLIYVIGSMYILPLVALSFFGLYLFFFREKPKIKIGVFATFFILLIVFSAIILSNNASGSKDVFTDYNVAFNSLKGNNFALDRTQTSKLGGGLIGYVVYFTLEKLLDTAGINVLCYIVIFASLFMILKPIIYHLFRWISSYITKRGRIERKRRESDDDDVPPEFNNNDYPIDPSLEDSVIIETKPLDVNEIISEKKSERKTAPLPTQTEEVKVVKTAPSNSEIKIEPQFTKPEVNKEVNQPVYQQPVNNQYQNSQFNNGYQPTYQQPVQSQYQQPQYQQPQYQQPQYQQPYTNQYNNQPQYTHNTQYTQQQYYQQHINQYPNQQYVNNGNMVNQYPSNQPQQGRQFVYQPPVGQFQQQYPASNQNMNQGYVEATQVTAEQQRRQQIRPSYVQPPKIEIEEVSSPKNEVKPADPFITSTKVQTKPNDFSYQEPPIEKIVIEEEINKPVNNSPKQGLNLNTEVAKEVVKEPVNETKPFFKYSPFINDLANKGQTNNGSNPINKPSNIEVEKPVIKPTYITSSYANYLLPSYDLLKDSSSKDLSENHDYVEEKVVLLNEKLDELKVKAEVVDYQIGPTVTRIEIKPDVGVKVAQINAIKDDLMMGMAVRQMRMESPIPGKSAIGVEIPNLKRTVVRLKEVLQNELDTADKVMISLGKDVDGKSYNVNLAKMPHLLIAGGSGSGKSVCINAIILSLLMRYSPEELRFILVDLKQVELNAYNDMPHLVCPIITNAKDAIVALNKLVIEMTKRYDKLKEYNVKDIVQFNKLASFNRVDKMPYIILIIDELADLMATSSKDVESSVQRLSQLARAAGIHLIFATQRPSVDVIIGVIKVNFLSRVAFKVFSQIDSKTIIERAGAEDLLGDGDMLFSTNGSVIRIQGAFVDDGEIHSVVSYCKSQAKTNYYPDFLNLNQEERIGVNLMTNFADNNDDEVLYETIKRYVMTKRNRKAATSEFQRKFSIGFGRAGRMMDRLEDEGIVSPGNGNAPRDVLKSDIDPSMDGDEEI